VYLQVQSVVHYVPVELDLLLEMKNSLPQLMQAGAIECHCQSHREWEKSEKVSKLDENGVLTQDPRGESALPETRSNRDLQGLRTSDYLTLLF
jgi:hypothetical protein